MKRPDGSSSAAYVGYESWSPARWAWEFLRRNEAFIEACKKVAASPVESREAAGANCAAFYGLKKFKDYRQRYGRGVERPRFLSASVSVWLPVSAKQRASAAPFDLAEVPLATESGEAGGLPVTPPSSSVHKVRTLKVGIRAGQLLVRFDLNHTIGNSRALGIQLSRAQKLLEQEQAKLLAKANAARPGHFNKSHLNFLRHLRALDLRAAKKSWPQIALILLPEEAGKLEHHQIKTSLLPRVKEVLDVRARHSEIAAMGFRGSLAKGRPSSETEPPLLPEESQK